MLLQRTHRHLKTIARGMLAMAGVLWLSAVAAPCALAQDMDMNAMSGHCPKLANHSKAGSLAHSGCDLASSVNCQAPDTNSPLISGFGNFATIPVLLTMLPATVVTKISNRADHSDFLAPDYPDPPLHLRHLVLLR